MPLSRRRFFQTSFVATAAALTAPPELLIFAEPRRAPRPGGPILLNSNENAYGPWPSVSKLMLDAVPLANRYPDASVERFVEQIADLHRVKREQVVLGCGSSEILRICAEIFTSADVPLVTALPTFEAIFRHTRVRNREAKQIPLTSDFAHDLDRMADAVQGHPALVYICNPNNPTASLTPRTAIEGLLPKLHPKSVILIDEAYHHFALSSPDYTSFLDKPVDDERIIVARTFSKVFGLAGMRMGYAVAAPATASRMAAFALPDNLNTIGAEIGGNALRDVDGLATAIKRNAVDRDAFIQQAKQRNLKTIPSFGNFAMIDTGRPIQDVIAHFRQNNIAIGRPFPPFETYARISLGKPAEMAAFWRAWDGMHT
jgi:histidinol-phosphate aminotransferase